MELGYDICTGCYNHKRLKFYRTMQNLVITLAQEATNNHKRLKCYRTMQNLVSMILQKMCTPDMVCTEAQHQVNSICLHNKEGGKYRITALMECSVTLIQCYTKQIKVLHQEELLVYSVSQKLKYHEYDWLD